MAEPLTAPQRTGGRLHPVWGYAGALLAGLAATAALTAPLSAELGMQVGEWAAIAVYVVYGALLTRHDLRDKRLPDQLTLTLAAALAGNVIALAITTGSGGQTISALAGGLTLAVILTLIGLTGQLGFGDVKLALSIGILTGWHAWYLPAYALVAAYLLALPHAIIGAVRRHRGSNVHDLPFGPYLLAGGLVVAVIAATTS